MQRTPRTGGVSTREIYVDFEHGLNSAVRQIRSVLEDDPDHPRYLETVPKRGYRFIANVSSNGHGAIQSEGAPSQAMPLRARWLRWKTLTVGGVLLFVLAAGVIFYLRRMEAPLEKATIMVDGFVNRTGDTVFDDTIRQGLAIHLEQSPIFRIVPEEEIRETLKMMGHTSSAEFAPAVAREVCQRTNASILLNGSIASIGNQYELVLQALDCASGELVASADARSQDKNHVLDAVSKLENDMRRQPGESLSSVRRYATPLAAATTPSLAALPNFPSSSELLPGKVAIGCST